MKKTIRIGGAHLVACRWKRGNRVRQMVCIEDTDGIGIDVGPWTPAMARKVAAALVSLADFAEALDKKEAAKEATP